MTAEQSALINAEIQKALGAMMIEQIAANIRERELHEEIAALKQQLTERQDNGG